MTLSTLGYLAMAAGLFWLTARSLVRKIAVPEGYAGLLYRDGRFLGTLPPGVRWVFRPGITLGIVDTRLQVATIPGQEVLSKDRIPLKISAACRYSIEDAEKATHDVTDATGSLYLAVQLALRDVMASVDAEEILDERSRLGMRLLDLARPEAEMFGIRLLAAEVKDVMLAPDLKRAFSEVLKARKEAQAALERARGESAALRHLANGARVLEKNPALLQLRMLESIDTAGKVGGNTLVLGVPHGAREGGL